MDRGKYLVAACPIEVDRFYDVDLTGSRPFAIRTVLREHPERGPQTLAGRELDAGFDAAILECEAVLGVYSPGCKVVTVGRFAARRDLENAVNQLRIVRQVVLQFIITPTRRKPLLATVTRRKEPGFGIQLRAVKLVIPDQRQKVTVRYLKSGWNLQRWVIDVLIDLVVYVGNRDIDGLDTRKRHFSAMLGAS